MNTPLYIRKIRERKLNIMDKNKTERNKFDVHILTESALCVALASVLSLIKIYEAPFGGAVTLLSMAPIIVLGLRRGNAVGLAGGFVFSVIQLVLGLNNIGWVPDLSGKALCVLFDYIIPFTVLGLGGMFRNVRLSKNDRTNAVLTALLGTLAVTLLRFACHVVSGVVIWYSLDLGWYSDDPTHIVNRYPVALFSLIYNGWFMVPEIIETLVGVPLIHSAISKVRSGAKK